jgi:alpha/beta superfamily hydrolase
MHPFFFGSAERRLFGVYHPAESSHPRDAGVVLCYPFGHEYIRVYRGFRTMAIRLADAGFHVLRFDYYACGDSSGDSAEGSVRQWISDIRTAVEELRDMASVSRVSLVGIRFGATLAAFAAQECDDIDHLILWDPIGNGARFLDELRVVQKEWLRTKSAATGAATRELRNELIGFPLPEPLAAEFQALDIAAIRVWRARHLNVLMSSESDESTEWRDRLRALPIPRSYRHVPGGGDWTSPSSVHHALMAHEMMHAIAALLGETGAQFGIHDSQD